MPHIQTRAVRHPLHREYTVLITEWFDPEKKLPVVMLSQDQVQPDGTQVKVHIALPVDLLLAIVTQMADAAKAAKQMGGATIIRPV